MEFCSCCKVLETIFGLLVMLVVISYATIGEAVHCDGRLDGSQCYGPLGGTVVIKLINSTSEDPSFELRHKADKILRVKQDGTHWVSSENKYYYFPDNYTLIIRDLAAEHSGSYTLEIFHSDGRKKKTQTFQLLLEAPVSSVKLIPECLSDGRAKVSCVSEGGMSPKYNLTLDGNILSHSELLSENNNANIILKSNKSGNLVCSVSTNVSSLFIEKYIPACGFVNCTLNGTHISKWVFNDHNILCDKPALRKYNIMELWPIIVGALGALLITIAVVIACVCAKRKKHSKEGESNGQELSNANPNKRQQEQSGNCQIQYGQVKKQPRQSMMYGNIENSVYGNVGDSIYANI